MRKSVSLLTAAALGLSSTVLATTAAHAVVPDPGPDAVANLTADALGADPAPTGLRTTTTGNRTVNLSWDPVAGASKYTVKVAVAANPDNIPSPSLGAITYVTENAKVGNLTNGVDYSFQVSATVGAKLTDYSAPVYGAPTPGEVPSNLRVTDIGNGAVYLDFDASDRATAYKINTTIIDANGVPAPLAGAASVNTATSSATVTKLSNGVEYGFQVAAVVDGYNTDWSTPKVAATPVPVPNKAGTPAAGVVTGSSIQVKWAATAVAAPAEPVDFYQVSYGPSLDATPTLVRSDTISYTATGVTAGVEYLFKVRAHNPAGYGPWSLPLKVVAADKPGAVTNLSALRFADGHSIDLTWTAPKFAGGAAVTKYVVAVSPKVGTQVVEPVPATHATLNGLDPATDYKVTVTAYTAAGAGGANSVTSLAQSPKVSDEPVLATDGSVTWSFQGVDRAVLDYEAQATQLDYPAAAKGAQLSSRTTVTADTVSCTSGVCTATWKRFGDDIDGEAWLFRVRATDNVSAYSNWASINPAPPVPVEQVFSAQQETGGAWSLLYGSDWAQRTSDRFLKASANGAPFQSATMTLGKYPGSQTVTAQGLGGTAAHTYALTDGPTFNEATGGSVQDIADYNGTGQTWRVHTFQGSNALVVTEAPNPFRVLIVGAGNNGGSSYGNCCDANLRGAGNGGQGGSYLDRAASLSLGINEIVVGSASGQHSSIGSMTTSAGTPGGAGGGAGGPDQAGGTGAWGVTSDITGVPTSYAGGGGGGGNDRTPGSMGGGAVGGGLGQAGGGNGGGAYSDCCSYDNGGDPGSPGAANTGGGGGGAGVVSAGHNVTTGHPGGSGGTGIVVVAYRIG